MPRERWQKILRVHQESLQMSETVYNIIAHFTAGMANFRACLVKTQVGIIV